MAEITTVEAHRLLLTHLRDEVVTPNSYALLTENIGEEPAAGLFLVASVLPGSTNQRGTGSQVRCYRTTGVLKIGIFVPIGDGAVPAQIIDDQVKNAFLGRRLSNGSNSVVVSSAAFRKVGLGKTTYAHAQWVIDLGFFYDTHITLAPTEV